LQSFELTKGDLLSYKMNVKLHMLRSAMMHWIFSQVNCRDIVTIDYRGLVDAHMQFAKQIPEPTAFRGGVRHGAIFSFSARPGYRRLSLGRP
jgi:hypothetical protein